MKPDLPQRILTSLVVVGVTAFNLFCLDEFWFTAEVFAFIALALFEFFTLLRNKKVPCFRLFGVAMGLIIAVIVAMEQGTNHSGEILFLILGCLFLFLLQFSRKDNSDALVGISLTLFGILYVGWFLTFLIRLRYLEGGVIWIAYLISVTKAADIGAYLVGSTIGKNRLIPHVSPNKSVEGMFGGLAGSVLASLLFYKHLPLDFSLPHLLILGLLIGIVGQIGDLSESLMKRFCEVKDSGRILPGMGGVLDAVDSILFTAPIFYFHLKLFL